MNFEAWQKPQNPLSGGRPPPRGHDVKCDYLGFYLITKIIQSAVGPADDSAGSNCHLMHAFLAAVRFGQKTLESC